MQRSILATAIVALGVGGVTGYWLGSPSSSADEADTAAAYVAAKPRAAAPSADHGASFADNPFGRSAGDDRTQSAGNGAQEAGEPSEAHEDARIAFQARDLALATVDQLGLVLSGDPMAPGRSDEIQALKQALLDKATTDSLALQSIISAFTLDPDSDLGQHLGSLLAEIKDPEVEAMALQMARSGTPDQMKAGLEVLGELGIPNQETLALTRQIARQPFADPDILMGAIHAMPVMPLSQQETQETISTLAQLASTHPSDGVRSNSLFKISEWAKDGEDLQPVLQALDTHRPTDDRISAAMALAQSTVVDDSLRQTLIARMTDGSELWEVRQYSATALERFKLNGSDFRLLESFRNEQVDLQTNG